DLADEITDLLLRVGDASAIHHMGDRAMADLAIGRVLPVQQRIDHRVLEMRATPPGHEGTGIAAPALLFQERSRDRGKATLHVDNRAVLVEHADFDIIFDIFMGHFAILVNYPGPRPELLESSQTATRSLNLNPDAARWRFSYLANKREARVTQD